MLDQVEERLLAPLDVVEDAHERRALLEQLAEGPGDLLGACSLFRLPPSRERSEAAAAGSEGSASSCFTTSTTGQ